MSASGKKRRSVTKPNEDKHQTTLKKFFHIVSKDEEQEKFKAILVNKSGSDFKEDLKEHEKENEGDTKNVGYVKVFRKWNTCCSFKIEKTRKYSLCGYFLAVRAQAGECLCRPTEWEFFYH